MGWLVSMLLFISYLMTPNEALIIASGLFAIAGAISFKDFYKK